MSGDRYFIAINFPEQISGPIRKLQNQVVNTYQIMPPLQSHITLLPPNLVSSIPKQNIIPQIKNATDLALPIEVTLTDVKRFDKRVVYLSVESTMINSLQNELVKLLPADSISLNERSRPFRAHVTLAQSKPKQALNPAIIDKFKTELNPKLPQSLLVHNLSLFSWVKPRTYEITEI